MSIGICDLNLRQARRLGLALVCFVSVSACVGGEGFSFASKKAVEGAPSGVVVPKSTSTTLARGAVKLTAPKGYCIDDSSVSNGLQGSSAMLAKCSALDGKGATSGTAVMSVQVSARRGANAPVPSAKELAEATAPRQVLTALQKGNLALVKLASGGDEVFSPADPIHWRGATALDTRLVLLGLFAPQGSELTTDKGAQLLVSLARGLSATRGSLLGLSNSQAKARKAEVEADQPKGDPNIAAPDTVEREKKGAQGLIARLLNRS